MVVGELVSTHLLGGDQLERSVSTPFQDYSAGYDPNNASNSESDSEEEVEATPRPVSAPHGLAGVFKRLPRGGSELDTSEHDEKTVLLNVYDVSDCEQIQKINRIFTASDQVLVGGVFHAGVELHGVEWGFGGTEDERTGVGGCAPRGHPHHKYRCTVPMGRTNLSREEVHALILRLAREWPGTQYNLIHRNCLNFCNALLKELGLRRIPGWVDRASRIGSRLDHAAQTIRAIRTKEDAREQAAEAIKAFNQKAQEKIQAFGTNLASTWMPLDATTVFPMFSAKVLARQLQDKLGEQQAKSPSPLVAERTVMLEPGPLGIAMTVSGKITHVGPSSQAEAAGVKVGWKILAVAGQAFSEESLDAKILGAERYSIVFRIAPKRSSKQKFGKKSSKAKTTEKECDSSTVTDLLKDANQFRCPYSDSDENVGDAFASNSAIPAN